MSAGTLLHQIPYGLGRIDRWAVNIPREVVLLQQGIEPVLEDGIPALDGTGKVNEGILKADDAIALDWHHDRASTVSGQKHFAVPHADLWRECLISHLVSVALEFGMTIPFIGYWPEGVDHMAMISFDSDQNQDAHAEATLELMDEVGVKSTWCMIEPGYSAPVYERVKAAGHELALHYNALEIQGGRWDSKELARQHQWFRDVTAIPNAISNKNHYTRFEGWGELFEWCEREGIQADQTRGPSKPGNVGFLFGTCHPYYPMSWFQDGNRLYDVLEIGFLTQDMDLVGWADSTIIEPFLDQVKRVDGVAHFLFHQVHIHRQEKVRDAMRMLVRQARRRGFQFWTCEQINEWCRARRMTVIDGVNELGEVVVHQAQPGTVVWIPVKSAEAAGTSAQIRFGHLCRKQVVSERKPSAV
ncbi:hypothetical protein [Paenibacillus sp. JCM 10914]|uniref:hypothetical protein n=1 Tax=Paenibacillus sp. JCM 10914 TaxID=1236974 RepID=UPI0003CC88F9|nr:hypothetical protein [Paenibacillus sp. JCM 10914]GAE06913.1 hypothetical protein JCM10914_3106 [Paenibacillus sp. JCM 10914]